MELWEWAGGWVVPQCPMTPSSKPSCPRIYTSQSSCWDTFMTSQLTLEGIPCWLSYVNNSGSLEPMELSEGSCSGVSSVKDNMEPQASSSWQTYLHAKSCQMILFLQRVGVDYFGPFLVKRGRVQVKRYGVIFTCLAIRAVHLEVASSLDTDACLNAIRRFIARKGQVKEMYSGNNTNFRSADSEMRKSIKEWNFNKIEKHLQQRGVRWNFNPPAGSHHGGSWERLIRSVRKNSEHHSQGATAGRRGSPYSTLWGWSGHKQQAHHKYIIWPQRLRSPHTQLLVVAQGQVRVTTRSISQRGPVRQSQMETGSIPCGCLLETLVQRVSHTAPRMSALVFTRRKLLCRWCGADRGWYITQEFLATWKNCGDFSW